MKPILFNTEMVKAILDGRETVTRRLIKDNIVNGFDYACDGTPMTYCDKKGQHWDILDIAPYEIGDILYVRETYANISDFVNYAEYEIDSDLKYLYKCDDNGKEHSFIDVGVKRWRPSIHMPKEAARIFLRVTDVRVERLHDITEEQAVKEGIKHMFDHLSLEEYERWAKRVGEHRKQDEQPWENYLWHGNFGLYGTGNKLSDGWEYQSSGYELARDSFSSLWNTTVELKDWEKYGWGANPWVWVIEFERISKEDVYDSGCR